MIESLGFVVRFVAYAGILTVVGAVAFRLLILKRVGVGVSTSARASRRAARLGTIACGMLLMAALAKLVLQTAEMRFPGDSWLVVGRQMLLDTEWGTVWMIQFACALLLSMSFTLARKDALPRWSTIATLSVVLAASFAFSSHAMSARRFGQYAVAADLLHLLAASAWIGTLFVMTVSVLRGDAIEPGSELTHSEQRARYIGLLLRAFSPVAQVSVALVLISGVVSALAHLQQIGDLLNTPYGQALYRKLIFVVLVMVLGWRNWKFVTPRLVVDGPRAMTRGMVAEVVGAVVVLALTSALVVTPPPGE
ncbi:MAG: CopD family protein [Phycisphaerae bacterium]|nr:CopD family protein [Gemmatimonadaceae bacterium]